LRAAVQFYFLANDGVVTKKRQSGFWLEPVAYGQRSMITLVVSRKETVRPTGGKPSILDPLTAAHWE
jgi:hypothetical protein